MNFVRVKKRGQDQKTQKTWMPEGSFKHHTYRITWAREVHGVTVKPHYHATVWSFRNLREDHKQWDFAGRRGPYKTFEAAVEACEQNEKAWQALIEASEGERTGRNDRLRTIEYRSRLKFIRDKKPAYQKTLGSLPVWAAGKVNSILQNFLFPVGRKRTDDECDECDECDEEPTAQSGPTETSPSSSINDSDPAPETTGPVLTAQAADESTTPKTRRAQSKATRCETASSALPAVAPVKARGKRATKPTKPESTTGSDTLPSSSGRKPSAKVGKPNSRRKSA